MTTLAEQGGYLVPRGTVDGLGKGERIYAVRFMGDAGYVVTFRETDPLYTLDLSDPDAPRVRGELKIPGYSAYLHPVGDGLLLGIGQDADEETGRVQGLQISLFDVSDLARPARLQQRRLGDRFSSSAVEWNHHAFLWWPATKLAMLPVDSEGFAGVAGFTVDRAGGIAELGRISHPAPRAGRRRSTARRSWAPPVHGLRPRRARERAERPVGRRLGGVPRPAADRAARHPGLDARPGRGGRLRRRRQSRLRSIPKIPRATFFCSALPWRERRKSPMASAPDPPGAGALRGAGLGLRGGGMCSIGVRRSGSPAGGSSLGSAGGASRPARISRALCASVRVPYSAHSGEAFAAPSMSSAGSMREAGATIRVCTTGVGTPFSESSVTAASPMPTRVSSVSTS